AETKARVKLIEASARQIESQMEIDPAFARAAGAKFARKIVRERTNLNQIMSGAVGELSRPTEPSYDTQEKRESPPISEDWLNVFENEGAQLSSDEMQRLFSKILAGEIRNPGTFSIKTVRLVAQLDNRAAHLFRILCSLSVSLRPPQQNFIFDA